MEGIFLIYGISEAEAESIVGNSVWWQSRNCRTSGISETRVVIAPVGLRPKSEFLRCMSEAGPGARSHRLVAAAAAPDETDEHP